MGGWGTQAASGAGKWVKTINKCSMTTLLKTLSHFHGNPDQHCPFVLKPPLIADVSEFRQFPRQQQVTRAIFKLFEPDKKIAKIISIPRAVFIFDMHQREGGIPGIPTIPYHTRHTNHWVLRQTIPPWPNICSGTNNIIWQTNIWQTISDKPNMCYTTIICVTLGTQYHLAAWHPLPNIPYSDYAF